MVLHVGWHTCTPPSIPPFVHHDFKSLSILLTTFTVKSNNCICIPVDETLQFLLDAVLTPKVADFGFVTPMPVNVGSTVIVTAAGAMTLASSRGTYMAPEFAKGRHGITSEAYSYGVVSCR